MAKKNLFSKNIKKLENKINYKFNNPDILQNALTHESFAHEYKKEILSHYERLEFLGDAVLGLIIAHILFSEYTDKPEGWLAKTKALLVSEEIISQKAMELELGEFIFLGKGERKTGGKRRVSILADSFEALIGALFLDSGYKNCKKIISQIFKNEFEKVIKEELLDFKTALQEITQEKFHTLPKYDVIEEIGMEHEKIFHVSVGLKNKIIGNGYGRTKKEASQLAAKEALIGLKDKCLNLSPL